MRGIRADPNLHLGRFGGEFIVIVPDRKSFGLYLKLHLSGFAGSHSNLLESLQHADWFRHDGPAELNVKLYHFVASSRSSICDVGLGGYDRRLIRAGSQALI